MKPGVLKSVAAAAGYEFRMQIRRKALWIVMAVFGLLSVGPLLFLMYAPTEPSSLQPARLEGMSPAQLVGRWALVTQFWLPVALGLLLADRLPRDQRVGTVELFETLPARFGVRFVGKYLGATLATLVPVFLAYAAGLCYFAAVRGEPVLFPLGLAAFATVNLPGMLFVAAFSVACTSVLGVPLYQFLLVGYWFWGNTLNPDLMPTLSGTWLTPLGEYAANGFFGAKLMDSADAAAWEGVASVGLLLALGALALLCAHRYLRWQRARW